MQTHDIRRLFWTKLELKKKSPTSFTSKMWEDEEPYRASSLWVFKYWPTKGVGIGWWRPSGKAAWDKVTQPMEEIGDMAQLRERFTDVQEA